VTVINENPHAPDAFKPKRTWNGTKDELEKDAEEIGKAIRKEIGMFGFHHSKKPKETAGAAGSNLGASGSRGQALLVDTAVASDDEDDDDWASDDGGASAATSTRKSSSPKSRLGKATHLIHAVHSPKTRRRASMRRGSVSARESPVVALGPSAAGGGGGASASGGEEITEEPRGRDGRPTSASGGSSVSFAAGTGFRQGTGGSSGSSRFGNGAYNNQSRGMGSRPGTADTVNSARNHRVESIRALHSRPQTRESSPSRSVRWVDEEGRPGTAGRGSGSGSFGVVDAVSPTSPVAEESASGGGSTGSSRAASRAPSPPPVGSG